MRRQRSAAALTRDRRGVSAVEFGLIATPLCLVLLALIDLGFRQYMASMLQGTLDQAARRVTVGAVTPASISTFVTGRMRLILPGATVTVTPRSYDDFSTVGKPEPITTDTAPIGTYNAGDCFLDQNGNGNWDSDSGQSGNGSSDDIVYYTATARFPSVMPLGRFLGWSATETVTATMMARNQPYATQAQPIIICK